MEADTRHLFKAALAKVKAEEGFVTSVAPGSLARRPNRYYASDEEFLHSLGEAMREEYQAYQAIVEAGFVLQLDAPGLLKTWDTAARIVASADASIRSSPARSSKRWSRASGSRAMISGPLSRQEGAWRVHQAASTYRRPTV